jgi:hypothetical protein
MKLGLASLAVLLLAAVGARAAGPEAVGLIEFLKGSVFLDKAGKKGQQLFPEVDAGRVLLGGQGLILDRGAEVILRLDQRKETLRGPRLYRAPVVAAAEVGATLRAIRRFYVRAGRERPVPAAVLSPADGSVVQPSTLRFEWIPGGGQGLLSLAIQDGNGNRLWRRGNVPDVPALLVDAEARQALVDFRKTRGAGPLVLEIRAADSPEARQVSFSLLSEAEEALLGQELAGWRKEAPTSPLRYIGPATAYARRKMLSEAAAEYEAGLKALPKSRALREAAVEAETQLGNLPRVRELLRG